MALSAWFIWEWHDPDSDLFQFSGESLIFWPLERRHRHDPGILHQALMEKLFKMRWDYSDYKYNLGGYVCIPFSALGRGAAPLSVLFIHHDPYGHQLGSSAGQLTDYPHRQSHHPGHGFYQ